MERAAHWTREHAADAAAGQERSRELVSVLEKSGTGHHRRTWGDPATGPDTAGEQGLWQVKSHIEKEQQGQATVFQGQATQPHVFYPTFRKREIGKQDQPVRIPKSKGPEPTGQVAEEQGAGGKVIVSEEQGQGAEPTGQGAKDPGEGGHVQVSQEKGAGGQGAGPPVRPVPRNVCQCQEDVALLSTGQDKDKEPDMESRTSILPNTVR